MSAFAVIFERQRACIDPDMFQRVMDRLEHRGPDGSHTASFGAVTMGHWHFWTTPEEVGEYQPLELENSPFKLVFDGRLDNRSELMMKLAIGPVDQDKYSDAKLVLKAFVRWGRECVKHFIGEFAFVLLNTNSQELFCARDPLGERTLFYCLSDSNFIMASEPWAVQGAFSTCVELDECAIAHYFAFRVSGDGRTFFKNIFELMPAHRLIVTETGKQLERYWEPDFSIQIRYRTEDEYAEQFLALLDESVRCRLRSTTPVAVQMSGGLDSTSVACLAARALSQGSLTAISYIFDEFKDCDERYYIDAVVNHAKLNSIQFVGDALWPFKDWQDWPQNPNGPEIMAYRLLLKGVHSYAQQKGFRVLLTGAFGDHLYQGGRVYWLADLLDERKTVEAIAELKVFFQQTGLFRVLHEGCLQQAIVRLFHLGHLLDRWQGRQKFSSWLTSYSVRLLLEQEASEPSIIFSRHASIGALSPFVSHMSTQESFYASFSQLELRHPYRDLRLIEFILALPAYQLFHHGLPKHILRNAMRGVLPEVVRMRCKPTSLAAFYRYGAKAERHIFDACYKNSKFWNKFIRSDQLLKLWQDSLSPESVSNSLVPMLYISIERWLECNSLSFPN